MSILLSKITPPAEFPRASRPRLLEQLRESVAGCTSTMITGRTGSGKTLLCTDFARRTDRRVAWYKVDASEADPRLFFAYLTASLKKQRPAFGQGALTKVDHHFHPEEMARLAEIFIYELSETGAPPLLLVIEDLHLVYDAEWIVPFFRRLLPLLPAEAHLIMTGRSPLPAPLWRMRSKQMLCVIGEQELALTVEEGRQLFRSYGLRTEEVERAFQETHGRAAQLDLLARTLGAASTRREPISQDGRVRLRLVER